MGAAVLGGAVFMIFAGVLGGLWALAARVRRTGVGTGMLGPFDEMWHPIAVDSRIAVQAAEYRPIDAPAQGGPPPPGGCGGPPSSGRDTGGPAGHPPNAYGSI